MGNSLRIAFVPAEWDEEVSDEQLLELLAEITKIAKGIDVAREDVGVEEHSGYPHFLLDGIEISHCELMNKMSYGCFERAVNHPAVAIAVLLGEKSNGKELAFKALAGAIHESLHMAFLLGACAAVKFGWKAVVEDEARDPHQ